MTLKEKLCEPFDGLKLETFNKLEQIADDYAIEFADWLFLWKQNSIGEWKHQNKNKIITSTKQLLEIFKKEIRYGR